MLTFFSNVPLWVYPLFILLLVIGLRASKDRSVPIIVIAALPLLGIMTLRNIIILAPPEWVWSIAALTYAIGIIAGMRLQKNWVISRSSRMASVKGEWITLAAMMVIFAAGFVNGFLTVILPDIAQSSSFAALFTAITCLPPGLFMGRAITTLRLQPTGHA